MVTYLESVGKAALTPSAERSGADFAAAAFDEGFDPEGRPRGAYGCLFGRLDPPAFDVGRHAAASGLDFGEFGHEET